MRKFLTLAVAAFILYTAFQYHLANSVKTEPQDNQREKPKTEQQQEQPSAEVKKEGGFVARTISDVVTNILNTHQGKAFFENVIQPANKPINSKESFKINNNELINSIFSIKNFGNNTNNKAICGQVVTIDYHLISFDNKTIDKGKRTIRLGSEEIAPALDAAIVGMSPGQTRSAIVRARYTGNQEYGNYKAAIELKEIKSPAAKYDSIRIFDDEISYMTPLFCGKQVSFDAKIIKLTDGQIIFDSKDSSQKINMKLGDENYPIIFSHALHNKVPIGIRTVIAKGLLMKSFKSNYSKILPEMKIAEDEYFLIEFSNFTDE